MSADIFIFDGGQFFLDPETGLAVPNIGREPLVFVVGRRLGDTVAKQFIALANGDLQPGEGIVCIPSSVFDAAAKQYMQEKTILIRGASTQRPPR